VEKGSSLRLTKDQKFRSRVEEVKGNTLKRQTKTYFFKKLPARTKGYRTRPQIEFMK
jgi:hypothetical protein